jgi:4-hydroxyphenylpyruvate dioxygenase
MQTGTAPAATAVATTPCPINGTDFVEFYVGNARQASHYYRRRVRISARGLPRTGDRDP